MPSGLRVSRIDKAPAVGAFELSINGQLIGGLPNRTLLELTVASGEVLVEVLGLRSRGLAQVLQVDPGWTARVQIGRRGGLGLVEANHYLQVDPAVVGLPDRTLHPLNLSARTAMEWLKQKRALGEPLSQAQHTYLHVHQHQSTPASVQPRQRVPTLTELGAFAALGLDSEAQEADVREAFRLLICIHTPEAGQANDAIVRLEEAYRIAMNVVAQRVHAGVTEVGR